MRDLVGGGGSAKLSFEEAADVFWAAEERRRDFTVSLGWTGYGLFALTWGGEMGWKLLVLVLELAGDVLLVSFGETLEASWTIAGGGSSKDSWREARSLEPSWPFMSVEDAGVGNNVGRGIVYCDVRVYVVRVSCE